MSSVTDEKTEVLFPTDGDYQSFDDIDLSPLMRRAVARAGFTKPSPIQGSLIPLALEGVDVIGQARTGTGKTAAFSIPILEQLDGLEDCRDPQAIIVVPTRELADQVGRELERLAFGVPTEIAVLAGGKNINRQLRQLQNGVQVVVGTPGRLHDHLQRKSLRTDKVWCVVLDEADRMLDIGFRPQIERILRRCPRQRQTLLLSATLPPAVQRLAKSYMIDPQIIDCCQKEVAVETIEQRYFTVAQDQKGELLRRLLKREDPKQAIIFCRTKRGTDRLYRQLSRDFDKCGSMHGDMQQRERDRVLQNLRDGNLRILVATDVVGRGIDISTISHIINYDLPQDSDDYVHRVGRTGRMGRDGIAFTFVVPGEGEMLTSIEQRINRELIRDQIEGYDASPQVETAKPVEQAPKKQTRLNPMFRRVKRRR
ncbi:DEAD/DEAH box helicase [Crateriforma conspicua]|uniref:DEAD-box ATP-dependent RNA helicase CshA n=1 Tax=Crateriforma conspicua TaxID=2527996 RepID=A0A5C5Y4U8_9PLAN|nr:DEAD/DEAH box helicase [Crateriforma conspicua]QDV64893.1 DEAD-box ATP-dependent RNA helicase CshA [Crateriforma conspicua]TWT70290.1 DEAD-box ATP-dependent RNA helicase CshA [Crateriforma conspicua]